MKDTDQRIIDVNKVESQSYVEARNGLSVEIQLGKKRGVKVSSRLDLRGSK